MINKEFHETFKDNRPVIEPIPYRRRLLLFGAIILGAATLHIAGLVDDVTRNESPTENSSSEQITEYIQDDFDAKRQLAIKLPLFAAGATAVIGYAILSKEKDD